MKVTQTCALLGLAVSASGNPTAKVLDLLGGLQQKITKEGEESAKVFASVGDMCKDKSKDLGFAIETGKTEVEGLDAAIAKEESKGNVLTTKIEELVAAIAENDANLKAAEGVWKIGMTESHAATLHAPLPAATKLW